MSRAVVLALCLLTAACAAPTAQQKEDAINAALASAYVACKVALDDPKSQWGPGAKEYCQRITRQEPDPHAGCVP